MRIERLWYLIFGILPTGNVLSTSAQGGVPSFSHDVKPILAARCFTCHTGKTPKNGLDLSSRNGLLKGGKTGASLKPGSLRDSLIWSVLATDKMPKAGKKLTAKEKDVIRNWILSGAPATPADAKHVANSRSAATSKRRKKTLGVKAMVGRIDRAIDRRITKAGVKASPRSNDAEFLRRVYLDLNGRVPSYEETVRFLKDTSSDKRQRLIDERLASPEFGKHLAVIWHRLLIPKNAGAYRRIPHQKFRAWLAEQFNKGRGWDRTVTGLITAEGYLPSNKDNANARRKDAKLQPQNVATAFINVHNTEGRPQPKAIIASVSRLFLAQSIECAQCHNHPQAKWRQTDFWAAAAFFERVRYNKAVYGDTSIGKLVEPVMGRDLVYEDKKKGRYSFVKGVYPDSIIDVEDPNGKRTGRMIRATFLDGKTPQLDPKKSYRQEFAAWATSPANPYFSKAMGNRVWSQLLGRGFVEPVDDMSEDNRPSHPELLADLSDELAASRFDLKHLIRCICNSATYQRSSVPLRSVTAKKNVADTLFARQALKQLTGEQLIASLKVAVPTFAKALEEDARDKNPGRFKNTFLEIHDTGDGPSTIHTRGLQQALRMMNGDGQLFNREALAGRISESNSVEENIRRVYLQALNRNPTAAELKQMTQFVAVAKREISKIDKRRLPRRRRNRPDNTPDPYADIFWVLINSGEFIFNH